MYVALYARVSTDDKGQDPEVQLEVLRSLASSRGYQISREYVDYASGKDGNRPEFKLMMEAARKHEFDAIMALRVDRMMRSVINLRNTIEELQRFRVKLIFTDFEFDPDSPTSNLILNVISSIAEWERQIIAKRTSEGLEHARHKGSALGRPKTSLPYTRIARMRIEGMSWARISDDTNIPKTTLLDHKAEVDQRIQEMIREDSSASH